MQFFVWKVYQTQCIVIGPPPKAIPTIVHDVHIRICFTHSCCIHARCKFSDNPFCPRPQIDPFNLSFHLSSSFPLPFLFPSFSLPIPLPIPFLFLSSSFPLPFLFLSASFPLSFLFRSSSVPLPFLSLSLQRFPLYLYLHLPIHIYLVLIYIV